MHTNHPLPSQADALLTPVEASKILKVSESTLLNWRWRGCGPRWCKLGLRAVRYRASDLAAFVASGERAS